MPSQPRFSPAAAQPDFSKIRHQSDTSDIQLSVEGQALLASMDEAVRPSQLAAAFPRIINRMAGLWRSPRQMDRYFDDLLTDTRGNRQGFPLGILMELTTLKEHYQTKVFPPTQRGDVWQSDDATRGVKS
jgi:hypothetical protein